MLVLLVVAMTACQGSPETDINTTPPSPPTSTTTTSTTTSSSTTSTTTLPEPVFEAVIANVTAQRLAHSYTPDCPITPEEVVLIRLNHWGFDGATHDGEIVVARDQADAVVEIFRRLFDVEYPIESVIPIGDLPEGIEDDDPNYNNTSGLHCRFVGGTTTWSEHAKGLAIDVNPFLNPYITSSEVWPPNATKYVDRSLGGPGMITADDEVVRAFEDSEWHWGGYWSSVKDYHHFSLSGR